VLIYICSVFILCSVFHVLLLLAEQCFAVYRSSLSGVVNSSVNASVR